MAGARKNEPPRMIRSGPQRPRGRVTLRELNHVLGGRTLGTFHDVELDSGAFGQALEAIGLNRAVVDEAVLATVLRADEAEALLVVEPLDSSSGTHHRAPLDSRRSEFRMIRTSRHHICAVTPRGAWPPRPQI